MDPRQFKESAPGQLVEATDNLSNKGWAFLPEPLPPHLNVGSMSLWRALSEADRDLARLDGVSRQIDRPQDLFAAYLRREAVLSSKIEGTHTTIGDLALFEAAGQQAAQTDDASEVANYVKAFEFGRARCNEIAIGRTLFQELHALLMEATEAQKTTPGRVRDCMVVIGEPPMSSARFVPPPPHFVPGLLENLEHYLKTGEEPPLIKLAVAHYQFETIHPFRDGNGRLGRLLISLWLQREKILLAPMLYLSAFFEQNQQRYYDALLRVSTDGAWDEWIAFFLEGVSTQSRDAVQRTQKLVDLRASYRSRMMAPRMPANLTKLIDDLFVIPATSVPIASSVLGVTYQAARASMDKLIASGILKSESIQIGGTAYYVAPEIIGVLEARSSDAAIVT